MGRWPCARGTARSGRAGERLGLPRCPAHIPICLRYPMGSLHALMPAPAPLGRVAAYLRLGLTVSMISRRAGVGSISRRSILRRMGVLSGACGDVSSQARYQCKKTQPLHRESARLALRTKIGNVSLFGSNGRMDIGSRLAAAPFPPRLNTVIRWEVHRSEQRREGMQRRIVCREDPPSACSR